MRMGRYALALLAGTALAAATSANGFAEDVSVNLDALGPEPPKKAQKPAKPPAADAVRSEIVPDPVPMKVSPAKPMAVEAPAQPAIKVKPAVPMPVADKPATGGEIDFIGKTKRAQGIAADPAPKPSPVSATPKPVAPAALPPVMAAPVQDDPPAVEGSAALQPALPALLPKPVAPKKKPPAATVVVNSGGLDGEGSPSAKPLGTPLTSIQPDGALYIPKNVDALPAPVSVPGAVRQEESDDKPLTLPPALPPVPPDGATAAPPPRPIASAQPAANAPAIPKPAAMSLSPVREAQDVAVPAPAIAAAPAAASAKPVAEPARASVLTGQATAAEIKFEPGLEALTPEAQAALDQIAEPLKATALRVQLAAYSGPPGNNSSDTRRLSLKRALAVRDYLDSRGVPKLTVNIAAFGGAVQGETDRVDVMVRTDQVGRLASPQ